MYDTTKADWKLFRERIPQWQENYMDKLTKEYIALLQGDDTPSSKFWALDERIRNDKRKPGVRLELNKRNVDMNLMRLISDGAITFEDLEGFSEGLVERVKSLYKTFCN